MDQAPLVNEQIESGAKFLNDFSERAAITVAAWVQPSGSSAPYLYVASPTFEGRRFDGYGEVLRLLPVGGQEWLDAFRVRLVDADDPVALGAVAARGVKAPHIPVRLPEGSIGGESINWAYIYPEISSLKREALPSRS